MKKIITGIYKITSPSSKIYIGQSININKRFKDYFKLDCEGQIKLYNSLKKHGVENHKFEIIEECLESELLERETYWKNFYQVLEIPSLCCRIDGKGGYVSEETKRKMSLSKKGTTHSKKTKEKMSESHKGIKYSEESKQKMSDYHKNRIRTEEECLKISQNSKGISRNKGKKYSPEVRKTMGRKKGSKYSEEDKLKISKGRKGKKMSQETKDKISKANKGRIKSEKEIQKLKNSNPNKKSILQINPKTNQIINEFPSMKEAGRILGINANGITEVISGRQKTSFGYIWKLK